MRPAPVVLNRLLPDTRGHAAPSHEDHDGQSAGVDVTAHEAVDEMAHKTRDRGDASGGSAVVLLSSVLPLAVEV